MALSGKLIGYVEIINGDFIYGLFAHNPQEIAAISPHKVQNCEHLDGETGAVGSVICWHYTHEGKQKTSKQILEVVDDKKQKIVFKVIGGDLVEELYKTFTIILHMEEKGGEKVAAWTFEFEKPDVSVPYPTSLMDFLCNLVKDLNAYSLCNPK